MAQPTILVIDDEADLRLVLQINLQAEGYRVLQCANGFEGLELARTEIPDLVLLDLMLPGIDGLDICRELKASPVTKHIPIIMVTAKGKESDIVLGLGLGADDYIAKPFGVGEIIARIKAALRRVTACRERLSPPAKLMVGPITLDVAQHIVTIDGDPVELTATEFKLLQTLLASPLQVFSRELLIDAAIGEDVYVDERTIDTHIAAIRRKLGSYRGRIKTVWGVGYRLEE
jgi:DNA-binding response OmpR family regulator